MSCQVTVGFWSDEYREIYSGTEHEGRIGMKGLVTSILDKALGQINF